MDYKIGTTFGGLNALDAFTAPLPVPNSQWIQYQEIVELANGRTRGIGSPRVIWTFELINEVAARNELKTYCPDSSAAVFISTRLEDGTYDDFSATMRWPLEETLGLGGVLNLSVEFTDLVVVP